MATREGKKEAIKRLNQTAEMNFLILHYPGNPPGARPHKPQSQRSNCPLIVPTRTRWPVPGRPVYSGPHRTNHGAAKRGADAHTRDSVVAHVFDYLLRRRLTNPAYLSGLHGPGRGLGVHVLLLARLEETLPLVKGRPLPRDGNVTIARLSERLAPARGALCARLIDIILRIRRLRELLVLLAGRELERGAPSHSSVAPARLAKTSELDGLCRVACVYELLVSIVGDAAKQREGARWDVSAGAAPSAK